MHGTRTLVALALLWIMALHSRVASARTWSVERDGTGDYTTIPLAVQAASAGDTILIGPGRYTENAPFSLPGWTELTYVPVTKDNLTLMGTSRDEVIIGPTLPNFTTNGPKGIVTQVNVMRLRVQDLTLENLRDGMYVFQDVTVSNCAIRYCYGGIAGLNGITMDVSGCMFRQNNTGVDAFYGADIEITSCRFDQDYASIRFTGCQRANVRNCVFDNCWLGPQHDVSTGIVEYCTILQPFISSIVVATRGSVEANHNRSYGGQVGLDLSSSAHVSGTDNLFVGTTYAGVLMEGSCTIDVHLCDFLPASGVAVRTGTYLSGDWRLNLTNNYWGVETSAEIEALIWDGNDDPSIHAIVDYRPFAIRSVPSGTTSFGGLKARFGEGRQ